MNNIEKIAGIFPECITEKRDSDGNIVSAINFDLLKQILSNDVSADKEFYNFNWVGKKSARIEAFKKIDKTLRPIISDSKNFFSTQNLYIEGDNLDVLKLLQQSYWHKIKMIYIDPPYNTGKDFIYRDDFSMSEEDFAEKINLYDEDGNKNLKPNLNSNPRFHSDWCSMIYSRLLLSRNLLTDDGVIFISIDDNEQANLKKICDEVFGERNFIGIYIKQSKIGGGSDSKFLVKEHEYCIVYAKSIELTQEMFVNHSEEYLKRYKEEDEFGKFFWDTFARPGLKNPIHYDIVAPDGTIMNYGWIHSKERFEKELKENKVRIIPKVGGGWSIQFKQYLNESGKKPRSMTMDFGGNQDGKIDLKNLFDNDKLFSYPKSVKFIKTLISTLSEKDSIILDFFSGSATTAQAVMQLNSEDGGNRKFIMVQLAEKCGENTEAYKAGYKNICEIGKERIRRAGEKIASGDTGFRVLRTDSTNYYDVSSYPKEFTQEKLKDFEEKIKSDRNALDLLFGYLIESGKELNLKCVEEKYNDATIYKYNDEVIACFEKNLSRETIEYIAKQKMNFAILRDESFASDADKINAGEIFKFYSANTKLKVI